MTYHSADSVVYCIVYRVSSEEYSVLRSSTLYECGVRSTERASSGKRNGRKKKRLRFRSAWLFVSTGVAAAAGTGEKRTLWSRQSDGGCFWRGQVSF